MNDWSTSDCRSGAHKFESQHGHITFMEMDHETISTVILSLLLIQEGQLSLLAKVPVNPLRTEPAQEKCE